MINNEDFDIMGNIKLIENYKTFLLSSVADLFVTMSKGNKAGIDEVMDELSEIITLSYLLGKRLGVNYQALDDRIVKNLKLGLLDENRSNTERENQDYSKLISYIKEGREL
jgi:hypothetical protein